MNILKFTSFLVVVTLLLFGFSTEVHAGHHCKSRTSFGFNVNLGGPTYVVPPPPPPPPVYVAPAYPVYGAPVYAYPAPYSYYSAPVIVERPSVYVRPGVSYTYWRR